MAEITAAMVQELREATNVSMMECKRALVEAGGDKEKAIRILRERGMALAAKKASRTANQGTIAAFVSPDGHTGALIELNCETDFVARNPSFQAFAQKMAEKSASIDTSLADVAREEITAKVTEIGENIVARRNLRYQVQSEGRVVSYIHLGGKVGVLLEIDCKSKDTLAKDSFKELARDLALHIAACSPRWLTRAEVPADVLAGEREIYAKQVADKPKQIIDKIVDGKLNKFYGQVCFLEQGFVRDPNTTTITKLLDARSKELGDTLTIRCYARFQVGE